MRTWSEEKQERYRFVMRRKFLLEGDRRACKGDDEEDRDQLKTAIRDILGSGLDFEGSKRSTRIRKPDPISR